MSSSFWFDCYASDVQGVYAPIAIPALFLIFRLSRGRSGDGLLPAAARFVDGYAIAVCVQTVLDVLATGPLVRALDIGDSPAGTAVMLTFVLLGDFRVYLLLFALLAIATGRSWTTAIGRAAAWTLLVPALAYPTNAVVRSFVGGLDANSIWLIYETLFTIVALTLRERLLAPGGSLAPELRGYLSATLLYVAVYYALWAAADALVQFAEIDIGWALRVVPNQLYYAFWAPFVFFRFMARPRAATPPPRTAGAPRR